jgi:hypothetical protein
MEIGFVVFVIVETVQPLLEKKSIATVKYRCHRAIFVIIPSNSNNITFVDSCCNMWRGNRLSQQKIVLLQYLGSIATQ